MSSAVAGASSSPSHWTYIKRQSRVTVARSRKPTVPLTSIVEEAAVASVVEEQVSVAEKSAPACILEEDYLPSHSSPGLEAPTSALPDVPPPPTPTSKTQPQTRSRSRSVKARRRLGVSDLSPLSLFAASGSSSTSTSAFPSSPSRSPSGSLRFPASPTGSFLSQSPVHTPSRSPFFTPVLTTDADWRLTLAADSSSNSDSNDGSDSEEENARRTRTRTLDFPRPPTVSFDAFGFDFALDSDSDADPDTDSSYSPSHSSSAHSNSPSSGSGSGSSDGSASPTSSGAPTTPSPSPTADTYAAAAAQSHSPALHVQELPFTNAGRIGVVRCKSIKPLTITKRAASPMPSVPVASTSASSSPAAPTRALPASPALAPVLLPPVGQEQAQAAEPAADVVEEAGVEIEEAQEHEEDDASSWEDDDDFYAAHARGYITLAPPLPASFPALLSPALSSYASAASASSACHPFASKTANRESSILPTALSHTAHRVSRRLSRAMPAPIVTSPAHSRSGSSTSIKTIGGGGVVPNFSRPTSLAHRRTASSSSTVQVLPSPVVESEESTAERTVVVEDSVSVQETQKMVQEEEKVMEGEKVTSKNAGTRPTTSMCVMSGDYSYAADYAAYAPLLVEPGRCDSPRTSTSDRADSPSSSSSRLDALLSPPPAPRPLSPLSPLSRSPRTASVPVDVGDEWEDELSSYYHDVPLSPLITAAPSPLPPTDEEDEESPIEFAPPPDAIPRTTSPLPFKAEERAPRNRIDALTAAMAATTAPTPAPYTGWHPRPRASQLRLLAASSKPITSTSRSQCSAEEQTPATPATPFTPAYTTSPSSYSPHAYSPTQPLRSRWSSSTLSSVHSARSSTAHGHGHARSPKTFAFARRYFPKTRVGATSASSSAGAGTRASSSGSGTRTPKPHPKPMGSATVLRNSPFPSLARSMSPTSPAMPAAFRRGMSPKRKGKKLTAADVMTPHLSIGAADMTVGRPPAGASVLAMASVLAGVEDPFASPTSVRSPQAQWAAAYPASLSRASSGAWSTASSGDGSESDTSIGSGGSTRRRKPIPVGLFLR
ncbi:hypothetical protein C8R43DRAFT_490267 [Mycena crocata]|nr:hypothetical protein C8R43DRAFT_490267 [Mycena crocata]